MCFTLIIAGARRSPHLIATAAPGRKRKEMARWGLFWSREPGPLILSRGDCRHDPLRLWPAAVRWIRRAHRPARAAGADRTLGGGRGDVVPTQRRRSHTGGGAGAESARGLAGGPPG